MQEIVAINGSLRLLWPQNGHSFGGDKLAKRPGNLNEMSETVGKLGLEPGRLTCQSASLKRSIEPTRPWSLPKALLATEAHLL